MNVVKEVKQITEKELEAGIVGGVTGGSWHERYKDSGWVFVGGLNDALSEGDIICVMSQFGEIEDINLARDRSTNKSLGYAFIKYEDQRSTILAVDNLNGITLLKKTLRVDHVEKYRLPKDIREREEERIEASIHGGGNIYGPGGNGAVSRSGSTDRAVIGAGHAYAKKMEEGLVEINGFNVTKGVDLWAPVPTPVSGSASASAPVSSNAGTSASMDSVNKLNVTELGAGSVSTSSSDRKRSRSRDHNSSRHSKHHKHHHKHRRDKNEGDEGNSGSGKEYHGTGTGERDRDRVSSSTSSADRHHGRHRDHRSDSNRHRDHHHGGDRDRDRDRDRDSRDGNRYGEHNRDPDHRHHNGHDRSHGSSRSHGSGSGSGSGASHHRLISSHDDVATVPVAPVAFSSSASANTNASSVPTSSTATSGSDAFPSWMGRKAPGATSLDQQLHSRPRGNNSGIGSSGGSGGVTSGFEISGMGGQSRRR